MTPEQAIKKLKEELAKIVLPEDTLTEEEKKVIDEAVEFAKESLEMSELNLEDVEDWYRKFMIYFHAYKYKNIKGPTLEAIMMFRQILYNFISTKTGMDPDEVKAIVEKAQRPYQVVVENGKVKFKKTDKYQKLLAITMELLKIKK